jgi:hypothetical protein
MDLMKIGYLHCHFKVTRQKFGEKFGESFGESFGENFGERKGGPLSVSINMKTLPKFTK